MTILDLRFLVSFVDVGQKQLLYKKKGLIRSIKFSDKSYKIVFLWIMHLWHLQKMKTFLSWYICTCHKMALMTQSNGLNDIIIIQS